jgi:hypothetical protein
MNYSAKKRFDPHFKLLFKHFGLDDLPYDRMINELNREEYLKKLSDESYYHNLSTLEKEFTDEIFDTTKSLSIFFDQRDTMSSEEFNKALIKKYGDALNIERDIREIEKSKVLSNIDRNIKTIRGIIVFFFVLWIIASVISILF